MKIPHDVNILFSREKETTFDLGMNSTGIDHHRLINKCSPTYGGFRTGGDFGEEIISVKEILSAEGFTGVAGEPLFLVFF